MKRSHYIVLAITAAVMLSGVLVVSHRHAETERRVLVAAVNAQLMAHTEPIASLLQNAGNKVPANLEDAAYQELQSAPSTSLIMRSMVKVTRGTGGRLECVIDTSSLGVPARFIRRSEAKATP